MAVEIAAYLAPAHRARIEVDLTLPSVRASRTRLYQVLQNLMENAVKYASHTQKEAVVRLRAQAHRNEWLFTVEDNGPGIDPRHHERIFKMFQHAEEDSGENASGGMGLALVKRQIETMGGRAWVDSAVGKGSKFHFTLPRQQTTSSETLTETTPAC